jgi:acetolactate synthase-1/2/3 large subunit
MQLVYEMGLTKDVNPYLCLQENIVTGAADGYGRMAGKPAFTLLHVGAGFANGIAGLHDAGRANTPIVNIVGANATYHQPNYPEHELINGKIVDLARVVSHWTHEAKSANDLALLGAMATRYSRIGAGKICTIIAPTNCHWDTAVAPPVQAEPIETPKVSSRTIEQVAALLTNGKKTAIVLGSHSMYGDGLELAGRIAAKTGADLLGETGPSRFARGEGRVPVTLIPYLPEMAQPVLKPYQQLILVGALLPVTTFAYKDQPLIKVPKECDVTTLATVDHDMLSALSDLAKAVSAPAQPTQRQTRSTGVKPSGALTDVAIGQSVGMLLPDNAIVVMECPTTDPAIYHHTQGARAHDYMQASTGGAIGNGLPLALGAAIACPDRKTVVFEGDGSGMYTNQALWTMARAKANVVVVILKNDDYGILNIELARVREGDANAKMESMINLNNPTLNWVKIAEGQGVPASRATSAEEFYKQFEAAIGTKGPHLIEAQVVENIQPVIDKIRKSMHME